MNYTLVASIVVIALRGFQMQNPLFKTELLDYIFPPITCEPQVMTNDVKLYNTHIMPCV
jgi:hypothetical protein